MPTKYEHKVLVADSAYKLEKKLAGLGDEGWHIVNVFLTGKKVCVGDGVWCNQVGCVMEKTCDVLFPGRSDE